MGKSQRDKIAEMSDSELLKTYFEHGGAMTEKGFEQPYPINFTASTCYFALETLRAKKEGSEMLIKIHDEF